LFGDSYARLLEKMTSLPRIQRAWPAQKTGKRHNFPIHLLSEFLKCIPDESQVDWLVSGQLTSPVFSRALNSFLNLLLVGRNILFVGCDAIFLRRKLCAVSRDTLPVSLDGLYVCCNLRSGRLQARRDHLRRFQIIATNRNRLGDNSALISGFSRFRKLVWPPPTAKRIGASLEGLNLLHVRRNLGSLASRVIET